MSQDNTTDYLIIQITDTHLMERPEDEFVKMNPEHHFYAVMADLLERHPTAHGIIHTGDLAQVATAATYQRYLNYMQQFDIPFVQIPGNHDDLSIFPFHTPEPTPGVVEFGNWVCILLNSAVSGKTDGWIQENQLEQLYTLLTQYQDRYVVLACHHHPFEMKSQWIDQHKLKNTQDFIDTIAPFDNIKAVICGHVHQESTTMWNNIPFLSTPATCVQFKPLSTNFALDEIAPGYRSLHLKANGDISTEVYRLKDFNIEINKEISGY